jgi:hypothetical protein
MSGTVTEPMADRDEKFSMGVEGEFIATAWSNGGTSRGLRISARDRNRHLKREWGTVDLLIPDEPEPVAVNIDKPSMWEGSCRELIHFKIKAWFIRCGNLQWPKGRPPKVLLVPQGRRSFAVSFVPEDASRDSVAETRQQEHAR